jgi:beta-glucosidase
MTKIKTAKEIVKNMSLTEKVGQMTQLAPYFFIHDSKATVYGARRNLQIDEEKVYSIGSILGIGGPDEMIDLQKQYLEKSSSSIPLLFMADVIHGYKTIFPVPIALASSFNFDIAKKAARISAIEAYYSGIHVVFSPMCDLSRDPRWGRVVEGFGEDVYLVSEMVKAMVEGYTNDGRFGQESVASCIKHFAGYGAAEGGRDYNTVDLSRLSLYRDYLPAYKSGLDAGADLIMTAFNTLDGVPATINSFLLKDILREKWKSNAITIADYDALNQVITHGAADGQVDAAKKGIKAGLDIEMASSVYLNYLEDLIDKNIVKEDQVDDIVEKIIELKIKMGLFENPYSGANVKKEKELCLSSEHLSYAKECALESVVMLENNGILPLNKNAKIALIGPYAKSRSLIGPWSWKGRTDIHSTLEEVLAENLSFVSEKMDYNLFSEAEIAKIKESDVVILALGEDAMLSGEAHSRSDINLPDSQADLYKQVKNIAKATVSLIFAGRPLLLQDLKSSDAILMCWFLGSQSSEAIHDLIYGKAVPSGKLPMSFPRNVGQIPLYYNHFNTGRPFDKNSRNMFLSKYLDVENTPLYPFGYGLSYAKFKYDNLTLSATEITQEEILRVTVEITNESQFRAKEVIQLYIRDFAAEIVRPVKELKKIVKVAFEPEETKLVNFELNFDGLSYIDSRGNKRCESGRFSVMVGSSSEEYLDKEFVLIIK